MKIPTDCPAPNGKHPSFLAALNLIDVTSGSQTQLGIVPFSPERKTGPLGSGELRKVSRKLGAAEDGCATSTRGQQHCTCR